MKLFLDTNIFMEFVEQRKQFEQVCRIIDAILEKRHSACISTGCLYTLAFLFEKTLKRQDVHRPELTDRMRGYLAEVLDLAMLVDLSHVGAKRAVFAETFTDIEDSLQYQCAVENRCDVLVTINIDDYSHRDLQLEVLTPSQFVDKYL